MLNGYAGGMLDVRVTRSSTEQINTAHIFDSYGHETCESQVSVAREQYQLDNVLTEPDGAVATAIDYGESMFHAITSLTVRYARNDTRRLPLASMMPEQRIT